MPATYAADVASLNALVEIRPDFAPTSLLDVGAGPGTATWAAAEAFPSLQDVHPARCQRRPARAGARPCRAKSARFRRHRVTSAAMPARHLLRRRRRRSRYRELCDRRARRGRTDCARSAMWQKTSDTLLVVEPGTPAGYARIIALRRAADCRRRPCRGALPARRPMPARAPDWCHFTQRLQRSRAHKQVKGAEAAVRGREVFLRRADARAGRAAPVPGAGAARVGKAEVRRKTLRARRPRNRKRPAAGQGGLRGSPALALGRCGHGASVYPRSSAQAKAGTHNQPPAIGVKKSSTDLSKQ